MSAFIRSQIWWVLANTLGIAAFLTFASKTWIEPELANEAGASAGSFIVWGFSALPILVVFLLAHAIIGIIALRGKRGWALPIALTSACWIAAAVFDNFHHGI